MSIRRALVLLADGVEEMEAVIAIDVLRRGGVTVTVAGVNDLQVKCSRDVKLTADLNLSEALKSEPSSCFDMVILPGGLEGAKTFCQSNEVGQLLRNQEKQGGFIAAICAGPTALKAHGVGLGKRITSYPSVKDTMIEGGGYVYSEDRVVCDGQLITSRGPGTAFEFALALVEQLNGKEKANTVAKAMLL